MKDGDAVAADGDRISPDPEVDRREFLEEPDVSVLLSTKIAQDVIIGEIDLLCDAGLRLGLQMASILYGTVSLHDHHERLVRARLIAPLPVPLILLQALKVCFNSGNFSEF